MEKVVYVDMKALEERAAVSCWWPVGARTDRKLELIRECAWRLVALATLTLLDLNAQRTVANPFTGYGSANARLHRPVPHAS